MPTKQKSKMQADPRTPAEKFNSHIERIRTERKLDYKQALEAVMLEEPQLYAAYVRRNQSRGMLK